MSTKRRTKGRNIQTVKRKNYKKVVVSTLLAIIGITITIIAYQYTYQAKLEKELNQKQTILEEKTRQLDKKAEELNLNDAQKQELQKQIEELNKIKSDLERQLQAKQTETQRLAILTPKTAQASPVQVTGSKLDWLRASGIPENQWQYVDYIVSKESSWNPNAVNKSSGACGLGQQLPCGKWAGAWNDPVAALKAQYGYVNARYGGYAGAYNFWLKNKWY